MSRVLAFPTEVVHIGDRDREPPAARPDPEPFEVRIRFGVGDVAELIGYDRHAEPIAELRVPLLENPSAASKIGHEFKAFVRVVDELRFVGTGLAT